MVDSLIDKESGGWNVDLVRGLFLPVDVEEILNIPLCNVWPRDELVWHFTKNGDYSVRYAYHAIQEHNRRGNAGSSSNEVQALWKKIRNLKMPPRIRHFIWRACHHSLASLANIARRIPGLDSSCPMCGTLEDTNIHALFKCPFAMKVWMFSGVEEQYWNHHFLSIKDWVSMLLLKDGSQMGSSIEDAVAVAWGIWSARNRALHGKADRELSRIVVNAIAFVRSYHELQSIEATPAQNMGGGWRGPAAGWIKVNTDAGEDTVAWE